MPRKISEIRLESNRNDSVKVTGTDTKGKSSEIGYIESHLCLADILNNQTYNDFLSSNGIISFSPDENELYEIKKQCL